jgi:hypothetical protein
MAKIIALLGIPGSGKALVHRRLCETHGFSRVRFADPLRDMLRAGFGVEVEDADGRPLTQPVPHMNDYRPFHLMEKLAEWCRRRVSGDLLAQEWLRRVSGLDGLVVADDVHEEVEAAAVRSVGGIVVRITRPNWEPPAKGQFHRRIETIRHDVEMINHGPEQLAALTDALAAEVKALCSGG